MSEHPKGKRLAEIRKELEDITYRLLQEKKKNIPSMVAIQQLKLKEGELQHEYERHTGHSLQPSLFA